MCKKIFSLPICILLICISCSLDKKNIISLPSIISDNMVLQQKSEVTIWGKSNPSAIIKISSSWNESVKTSADEEGEWLVKIKTPEAGGTYEMIIKNR